MKCWIAEGLEGFVNRNGESYVAIYPEEGVISWEEVIEMLDRRRLCRELFARHWALFNQLP